MPATTDKREARDAESTDETTVRIALDPRERDRPFSLRRERRSYPDPGIRSPLEDHVHAVTLEAEVALLEGERNALERQVTALEADVASLKEEVRELEDALDRKDRRLQGIIDRYERILARRAREREGDEPSSENGPSDQGRSWGTTAGRFLGSVVSRLRPF